MTKAAICSLVVLALGGCWNEGPGDASGAAALPAMKWRAEPDSTHWTRATLGALRAQGADLVSETPADIESWCPSYDEAQADERRAFWAGLLSALAEYESGWDPAAVGGGGRWFGLVQISPETARSYGCAAKNGAALQDPEANLACAVRILADTVPRDAVVSADGGGVAADWGPFADPEKRVEMAAWTRAQDYCR